MVSPGKQPSSPGPLAGTARRGNCALILLGLAACLIGVIYLLLRTPPPPGAPPPKPVITSFPHDLAGKWQARLVKIHPPRAKRPDWKPSWMQTNFADFDAVVEIGKDFHIRRVAWTLVKGSQIRTTVEWTGPESWSYLERQANQGQVENRGESKRKGNLLTVEYRGSPMGEVRECRFEYDRLPPVPPGSLPDGGFREAAASGAIQAEVNLYAPPLGNVKLDLSKFRLELSPAGFQLANKDFTLWNRPIEKELLHFLRGVSKVSFEDLRKWKIDKIRGGELKNLQIKGYPSGASVRLTGCDCQFWYGNAPPAGDRVFVEVDQQAGSALLTNLQDAHHGARVEFGTDGAGRLFTHEGVMEYQLTR